MIDFHSHILPHMDDGAKDAAMSVKMLKNAYEQGVRCVVATSHCYPRNEESVNHFIIKRNRSYNLLKNSITQEDNIPKILLGCEINITTDISEFSNLKQLCIENTNYLLVEMPHGPWEEWMVDAVYKLTLMGIRPIIAHIDRYMYHNQELFAALSELDVIYQVNTDLFLAKGVKKITKYLIDSGHIHILGTDMHNLTSRKPNMGDAKKVIMKRYGKTLFDELYKNSSAVLQNEVIPYHFLTQKKGFIFQKKD